MKSVLLALGLLAFALAGCTSPSSTTTSPAPAVATTSNAPSGGLQVVIQGLSFSPGNLQVATGQTVTWVNHDQVEHTVTADDGSFDSGSIAPGGSYVHTFGSVWTVMYHCKIHSQMTGTLAVVAAPGMPSGPQTGLVTTSPAPPAAPGYP